ncbi:hypothetical protein PHYBOEH_000488 [Phytophthora boehmeriae]|uniref:Uncharacterized protein n=1 Tax=Phytophthora boehmeriae TaxID=109152 RepID=A0A8T1VD74_9STRA|nr:hypothetical protein PHYBOEH_000488 [Phytophthora boehmeriae]
MLPEFTEPFQMSVKPTYRPDATFGFKKHTVDSTSQLICLWQEDMEYNNGVLRTAGEQKLTWETMQAPVKSYAIEANDKYRLAVEQISAAWKLVAKARAPEPVKLDQVAPTLEHDERDNKIEIAASASEHMTTAEPKEVKLVDPHDAEDSEVRKTAATAMKTETAKADVKGYSGDGEEAIVSHGIDQPGVVAEGSNHPTEEAKCTDNGHSSAAVESKPEDAAAANAEAAVLENEAQVNEGTAQ